MTAAVATHGRSVLDTALASKGVDSTAAATTTTDAAPAPAAAPDGRPHGTTTKPWLRPSTRRISLNRSSSSSSRPSAWVRPSSSVAERTSSAGGVDELRRSMSGGVPRRADVGFDGLGPDDVLASPAPSPTSSGTTTSRLDSASGPQPATGSASSARKIEFVGDLGLGEEAVVDEGMEGMVVGRADDEHVSTLVLTLQLLEMYDALVWPSKQIDAVTLITANNAMPGGFVGLYESQPPLLPTLLHLSLDLLAQVHPCDACASDNAQRLRRLAAWLCEPRVAALSGGDGGSGSGIGAAGQRPDGRASRAAAGSAAHMIEHGDEWIVVFVWHLHAAMRRIRTFLFGTTNAEGVPGPAAATQASSHDLSQLATTAMQLFRALSVIATVSDQLLNQALGPRLTVALKELLLMQRNLAGIAATPKGGDAAAPPLPADGAHPASGGRPALERLNSWVLPEVDLDLQGAQETLHWLRCTWLDEPLDALPHVSRALATLWAVEKRFDAAFVGTMERYWRMYEQSEGVWRDVSGAESQLGLATSQLSNALRREEDARKEVVEYARRASARAQIMHWEAVLKAVRKATWSPWASEFLTTDAQRLAMKQADPHCQPAADWRLSNHRDSMGRRMLLVRNFKLQSHDNASHQASREIAEAENEKKKLAMVGINNKALSAARASRAAGGGASYGYGSEEDESGETEGREGEGEGEGEEEEEEEEEDVGREPQEMIRERGDEVISDVLFVCPGYQIPGNLKITKDGVLQFHVDHAALAAQAEKRSMSVVPPMALKQRSWRLNTVSTILRRRWLLQPVAVEVYFDCGDHEVFFVFKDKAAVHAFLGSRGALSMHYKANRMPLLTRPPRSLVTRYSGKAVFGDEKEGQKLLDKWRSRTITNFEYLMALNVMAGRSYNDLAQYVGGRGGGGA